MTIVWEVMESKEKGVRLGTEAFMDLDFAYDVVLLAGAWIMLAGMRMRLEKHINLELTSIQRVR